MSATDHKKKIIEFVKKAKPRSSGHTVKSQDAFLDGIVAKIDYQDGSSSISQYVIVTLHYSNYADSESQLIQQMNAAADKSSSRIDWINQIFNIGGLIALVLVASVFYLFVIKDKQDIPETLKAAFLTIVGFYFGGYIHQSKKSKIGD